MSGLKKELKQSSVWGLSFGAIIGTGCFFLPGTKFLPQSGPLGMITGIVIGMVMILFIALNYCYMIQQYPQSGGEHIFVLKVFGEKSAFVCSWYLGLAYIMLVPLNGTAAVMIIRYIMPGLLERGYLFSVAGWDVYLAEIAVAYMIIMMVAWFNLKGVKAFGALQNIVIGGLIGGVFLTFILLLVNGNFHPANLAPAFAGENRAGCIISTLAIAPFLFIGFDCVPQAAEECAFSLRKTYGILVSSILFATLIYIMVNVMTGAVMPWQELISNGEYWSTGYAIELGAGRAGVLMLGIAMFCAAISGINSFMMAASRLLYAIAGHNDDKGGIGSVNQKTGVPNKTLLIVLGISLIAPWFGRQVLSWIVDMTSVGGAIAYGFTSLCTYRIAAAKHELKWTITGAVGTVNAVIFMLLLFIPASSGFLGAMPLAALAIWTMAGLIVYKKFRKRGE